MKKLTEQEVAELERQLSCPEGEKGLAVADMMNESNINMTLCTIDSLNIQTDQKILELGHGNCSHLNEILSVAEGVEYYGLEISITMWEIATNTQSGKKVQFRLYDGQNIPFDDSYFDRIMTVNTIYFWKEPEKFLKEIERVLKTNGICVLTLAHRKFMEQLPFVKDRFTLYDEDKIDQLVQSSNFEILSIENKQDEVESKSGDEVTRDFMVVTLQKK